MSENSWNLVLSVLLLIVEVWVGHLTFEFSQPQDF